jgi:hypothetical protein
VIEAWIEERIREADFLLLFVTPETMAKPDWLEREYWLAHQLLDKDRPAKGNYSRVAFIVHEDLQGEAFDDFHIQPRNFWTKEPDGPGVSVVGQRHFRISEPTCAEVASEIYRWGLPSFEIVKDWETPNGEKLFESAMALYKTLIPIEIERDRADNIKLWLNESWPDGQNLCPECPWLYFLTVLRLGDDVIGVFWCTYDLDRGLGTVAFWGLRDRYRRYGRGINFALWCIDELKRLSRVPFRGLIFEAERVDWDLLGEFRKGLQARIRGRLSFEPDDEEWQDILWGKRHGPELFKALAGIDPEQRDLVVEELRRFRRFSLYANGVDNRKDIKSHRLKLFGLVTHAYDKDDAGCDLRRELAAYVQPSMYLPLGPSTEVPLWLFILMDSEADTPEFNTEAIDWLYHRCFEDHFGSGPGALTGWVPYFKEFADRVIAPLHANSTWTNVALNESFVWEKALLFGFKAFVRSDIGSREQRNDWDIQL